MTIDEIEQRIEQLEAWFDDHPELDGVEANSDRWPELNMLYGLRSSHGL